MKGRDHQGQLFVCSSRADALDFFVIEILAARSDRTRWHRHPVVAVCGASRE